MSTAIGNLSSPSSGSATGEGHSRGRKLLVGVVVPSLQDGGGVQSILDLLIRQIEASPDHDYLLISLATSASDECSTLVRRPSTWWNKVSTREIIWRGRKMIHVGCSMAELEFMHYAPRAFLRDLLAPCDLIQVVSGFPAWAAAVFDCGRPVCLWAATRVHWERRRLLRAGGGAKALWRRAMTVATNRLDEQAIRGAHRVMVMNPLMRDYVSAARPDDSKAVVYAPPGVDTLWFQPSLDRLSDDLTGSAPYVLSVGRFADPRKNPELLLDAFFEAKKKSPFLPRLLLAGSTSPSSAFWRKADDLGLTGSVDFIENPDASKLRELYRGALCFALSSDEEGFGMAIVEAMACGVPVIATRCGGPEGIITDGQEGFLVETGNAGAFAGKLIRICNDRELNHKLGNRARQSVEASFSEQSVGSVFFETWNGLMVEAHGSRK